MFLEVRKIIRSWLCMCILETTGELLERFECMINREGE